MADTSRRDALSIGENLHWYLIEGVLGQGGFGITYLARDTNLDQLVAIKEFLPAELALRTNDATVQPRSASDEEQYRWGLKRFVIEARTLAQFAHPNIVRVHSVFETNNTAYMVMHYERGDNLHDVFERRTLDEEELMGVVRPILDGLAVVHDAGFIHRDMQPANIYLGEDGNPVLLDFGAARQAVGKSRTVTILVAPGYAPFEQYYASGAAQGPWTDIYGLGATLYRAVTGAAPIDAIERGRGILGSTRDILVAASELGRGRYSERFLAAIDHALKFDERERPQTVAEWLEDFDGTGALPAAVSTRVDAESADPEDVVGPSDTPRELRQVKTELRRVVVVATISALSVLALGVILVVWPIIRGSAPSVLPASPEPIALERSIERDLADVRTEIAEKRGRVEVLHSQGEAEEARLERLREEIAPLSVDRTIEEKRLAELREQATGVEQRIATLQAERAAEAERVARLHEELRQLLDKQAIVKPAPATLQDETAPLGDDTRAPPAQLTEMEAAVAAYEEGRYGEALPLFEKLAQDGAATAQYYLGLLYDGGAAAQRDPARALEWFRKAARQGDGQAQIALGNAYFEGRAVPQDDFMAYIWYFVAAEHGYAAASGRLAGIAGNLQPVQITQAERLAQAIIAETARRPGATTPVR